MFDEKDFADPIFQGLEISNKILILEAFKRGVKVEVLDRSENFLLLQKGNHIEFVKQATKTRLDSYMTFLVLENKTVTKKVLKDSNIPVPEGKSYVSKQEAYADFELFQNREKVVKPVSTNFGVGVSILPKQVSQESFNSYIDFAFSFSPSIIIEDFLEGPEYRFLVIGGKCIAVCHRIPANVTGDGQSTIRQLVAKKNEDPRRGIGHTTPLEKIQLEKTELEVLSENGFSPESIPFKDQVVYLRKNSNISTGGDSIDVSDSVHESYKKFAVMATESIGAIFCGVDIILKNPKEPANLQNFGILECNFNPVLYIHEFPYSGAGVKTGPPVLDALGF